MGKIFFIKHVVLSPFPRVTYHGLMFVPVILTSWPFFFFIEINANGTKWSEKTDSKMAMWNWLTY